MSFKPLTNFEGKQISLPVTALSALVKFSRCKMSSGYLVTGATGDDEVEYIAFRLVEKFMAWDEPIPSFGSRFPNIKDLPAVKTGIGDSSL